MLVENRIFEQQKSTQKRKVHGMAETEPKKAKLDICPSPLDNKSTLIDYQQVIKSNESNFFEENKEDTDFELKNGQATQQITTNGKSLNNNNLNTLNLNSLKTEFNNKQEQTDQLKSDSLIIQPSHVVHLRNIPTDASEQEILNFGSTFGTTVNCLLLKGKNQAFLEFADLESAKSMVNYFSLNHQTIGELNGKQSNQLNNTATSIQLPTTIRGRQIFVQYSNYKKLQKSNDAQSGNQVNIQLTNNQTIINSDQLNTQNNHLQTAHKNNNHQIKLNDNKLNTVLNSSAINSGLNSNNLSVQNLLANSVSAVNQLNNNNNKKQLTINSLTNTNSLNMGGTTNQTQTTIRTNGSTNNNSNLSTQTQPSSVLRVIVDNMMYLVPLETFHELFSRFGKVTKIVTFNKNGAFQALIQFENNSAAASAKAAFDGQQMFASGNLLRIDYSKLTNLSVKYNNEKSRDFTNSALPAGPTLSTSSVLNNVRNGSLGSSASTTPLVNSNSIPGLNAHLNPQQQLALAAAASAAQHQQHYQHLEHVFSDPLALAQLSQLSSFPGLTNSLPYANLRSATLNAQANGTHHNSIGSVLTNGTAGVSLSSVLLCSNLSEQMATPDALFTLFGVYGDVIRVKILFNKKDNALVQMSDPAQAQLVINYLDKLNLFGSVLKISISKYSNVQMPKEGQPDSGLTKDYTSSPLHRFKKPGSKNYSNIFPPSPTLHLSNIPSTCTEQKLREAFETVASVKVVNFKFFPNDQKMALIQLNSIEDAVSALIKMHNYQLSESNHLRVSFSKSNL